jgi:F0F1-type ATP synthase assembly protein I
MRKFVTYLVVAIPAGILAGLGLGAYLDDAAIQESPITKTLIIAFTLAGIIFVFAGSKKK